MKGEELKKYTISEKETAAEALQQLDINAKGILFCVDEKNHLLGTVTDGDIRRWLIKTGKLEGRLQEIMNQNPKVIYRKELASAQEEMRRFSITALPVVDARNHIVDVIFRTGEEKQQEDSHTRGLEEITVVIMAGGKGTRLYPYTKVLPKPLIPIGDIPIMERIVERFCDYGVKQFYVTLNYRKSMIKSYFAEVSRGYQMNYVEEDKPLGTAGSLHLIQEKFDKPIIVTNCDILIHADYKDIYQYHQQSGNELTIVTALKNIVVPYGVINSKENGVIISMDEKPKLSYFVNTGMYVLNPNLLDEIPADSFFHMTDLANQLLAQGRQIGMYPISEDSFLDMGEFEEMHRMEKKLSQKSE
ncbi:MAG: nucleotidyltransferase family protein [Lachnospiraceae bacterium]|nr:nucleotidyltransferase family protein [Lachnospiraceae bacterium]